MASSLHVPSRRIVSRCLLAAIITDTSTAARVGQRRDDVGHIIVPVGRQVCPCECVRVCPCVRVSVFVCRVSCFQCECVLFHFSININVETSPFNQFNPPFNPLTGTSSWTYVRRGHRSDTTAQGTPTTRSRKAWKRVSTQKRRMLIFHPPDRPRIPSPRRGGNTLQNKT